MRHFKVKTETLFNSTPQFEYFPGLHILNEYQRNYDLNCLRLAFELGREKILIGCKNKWNPIVFVHKKEAREALRLC